MKTNYLFYGILSIAHIALTPYASAHTPQKKNVLFIAIDDLKTVLGCYGDSLVKSPNIDKLAEEGILFTNTYCQQAISGPSRASLLTGLFPDKTKVWDLNTLIRNQNPFVVTLPQYFKNNGYNVVGIGKIYDDRSVDKAYDKKSWSVPFLNQKKYLNKNYDKPIMTQYRDDVMQHYQSNDIRLLYNKYMKEALSLGLSGKKAEDYVFRFIKMSTECIEIPDDCYLDGATANGAIKFISDYNQDKPFFLAVGFKKPHLPFCAPKKYWDKYNRDDFKLANYRQKAINSPDIAYHNCGELCGYTDIKDIYKYTKDKNLILPEYKQKELIHGYYACVSYIDNQIGKLISALKQKGLFKNTIIVLWGDHGWHLGDHGLWNKHSNFENATRVPMIIVDPSIKHRIIEAPVELLDIYPTISKLAGLPSVHNVDGQDLSDVMKGKNCNIKPYAVSQYPRGELMGYSIRDNRYRYTIWVEWKNRKANYDVVMAEELYDYVKDKNETVNLINEQSYKEPLKNMKKYWEDYKSKMM